MWWIPPQPAALVHLTVAEAFPGGRQQRWGLRLCSSMCCIVPIAYDFYNWGCGSCQDSHCKGMTTCRIVFRTSLGLSEKGRGVGGGVRLALLHLHTFGLTNDQSPHLLIVWLDWRKFMLNPSPSVEETPTESSFCLLKHRTQSNT